MTHAAAHASDLPALLAEAATGAETAWEELVRRYSRRVFAMARSRRLDADTAEEITNDVFATLARQLAQGSYTEQGRFEPWLFRIAMNRVRDELRRRVGHATPVDPSTVAELAGAAREVRVPPTEELAALRRAMAELAEPDREVIELRHHASLSFQSIADTLGEPLGTVLARHHRALKKLRKLLEPDGSGSEHAP